MILNENISKYMKREKIIHCLNERFIDEDDDKELEKMDRDEER